jgi:hypothetical protein
MTISDIVPSNLRENRTQDAESGNTHLSVKKDSIFSIENQLIPILNFVGRQ